MAEQVLQTDKEDAMTRRRKETANTERPTRKGDAPAMVRALGTNLPVEPVRLEDIDLEDATFRFRVSIRVADLVDSIRQHGQQAPVLLRRVPDRPRLQVVSGFRRLAAIQKLGWPTVNALILEDLSDEQAWKVSVLENEARKTYSDLDRGYAILAWQKMGMPLQEVAEKVFRLSRKQASRLKSLVSLPPVLQEAVGQDGFTTTHALVLKQLRDRHGPKVVYEFWVRRVRQEGLSISRMRGAVLRSLKEDQEGDPIEVFVHSRDAETGSACIRLRPIRIDPSRLSASQRAGIIEDLKTILSLLEDRDEPD